MKTAFQDKVALITDATSGIGAEAARRFAVLGAKVVSGRGGKEGQEVIDAGFVKFKESPDSSLTCNDMTQDGINTRAVLYAPTATDINPI